jgi:hypothetical protein
VCIDTKEERAVDLMLAPIEADIMRSVGLIYIALAHTHSPSWMASIYRSMVFLVGNDGKTMASGGERDCLFMFITTPWYSTAEFIYV